MTKEELFKKYNIDESHNRWEPLVDNWHSVEVYRAVNDGQLPPPDGNVGDGLYVLKFLDECQDSNFFLSLPGHKRGSMYLTAKRFVYRHADALVKRLNV